MTDYARMAQDHWARWLPQRYSQIPRPELFFAELGSQVELEIQDLAEELEGPDEPGETYLQKAGRLNNARQRAREIILPQQVLLAPEPGADPDETPEPGPQESTTSDGEIPLIVRPGDPEYQEILDEEQAVRDSLY